MQHYPNESMVAPAISDRPADKGQDRQRQPRGFVRPEKRMAEVHAVNDIGEHQNKLAEQRRDEDAFRGRIDDTHGRVLQTRGR
jgi:hypothetical protein